MIVLDTNVVSELTRREPEPAVLAWVDAQRGADLFLTSVTVGELVFGLARLPEGRRRNDLATRVDHLIEVLFAGRIHSYDAPAARHFGVLAGAREKQGRPISVADGQIAAICLQHGAHLATRNTGDFAPTLTNLVNPWAPEGAP